MIRSCLISFTACLLSLPLGAQEPAPPPVIGRWDLTLTASDRRNLPSWFLVEVVRDLPRLAQSISARR